MTTPAAAEKALEKMKENPYFEKYKGKIAVLQQTSPDELVERVKKIEEEKKQKLKQVKDKEKQFSKLLDPKKNEDGLRNVEKEELNKIMKTELVTDKNAEDIKAIWEEYHCHKDHTIAATIPATVFAQFREKIKKYPTFIFPLPRSQGYEFMLCQFEGLTVHFTPLLYFQVHKENAPECLTIKHYTEYEESKGIVLMRGEYDKNIIDAKEAQCLANELALYYTQNDEEKNRLLKAFTEKPEEFKHMDLIKQIENLELK